METNFYLGNIRGCTSSVKNVMAFSHRFFKSGREAGTYDRYGGWKGAGFCPLFDDVLVFTGIFRV